MSGQQPSAQTRTPAASSGTALTAWRWVLQWRDFKSPSTVVCFKEVAVIPGEGGWRQEFKTAQESTRIMSPLFLSSPPDSTFWGVFILSFFVVMVTSSVSWCVCVYACTLYCVFLCEWRVFFIWMRGGGNKIKLHVYSQILINFLKKRVKSKDKSQSSCVFSVCW